jgi:hypothetical protein
VSCCRRIAASLALIASAAVSTAYAQSDSRFAVGGNIVLRMPRDAAAHADNDVGLLWRFGHGSDGWGFHWGLNWYSADIDQTIGGGRVEFGRLHVRPVMAGYGYTYNIGRASIIADVLGGYAFTSLALTPIADDTYHERLGARRVQTEVPDIFVATPEIAMWYDLSNKIGLNISGSYVIARPTVIVHSTLGDDNRHLRADMFLLRIGVAYSIF